MPKKKTQPEAKTDFSEQARTLDDVRAVLKKHKKCALVRPTGFGKTWILTELLQDKRYKKTLYLYPSAVVADTVVDRYYDMKIEAEDDKAGDSGVDVETVELYQTLRDSGNIKHCDLMTYAMLIRKSDQELGEMASKYNLIICDEAHRLGGAKTKIAMEKLFALAKPSTHFVGATATPTRMDNFDVLSHFYGDKTAYGYTIYDAIRDNILKKPNYCYMSYDFKKDLEDGFKADGQNINDETIRDIIDARVIELSKIYSMPAIIKSVCDKYAKSTDYMKFIIFFASKKHMADKFDDVVSWFREAYPDHNVTTLEISSRNKISSANTDKLSLLNPRSKTVDLIACIDMLNMGYHVSDQTGILMYRGTKSSTIFTQQLGRALSAGANNSAIVFDIVDNLHRKAVFELYAKPCGNKRKSARASGRSRIRPVKDNYEMGPDNKVMMRTPHNELIETQYTLDPATGKIFDKFGNESTFVYDFENDEIVNTADLDSESRNSNAITAQCLNATGHEASYQEIIRKAMVEPLVQRCKYAFQLHLRSWCYARGIKYPLTTQESREANGLDIDSFKALFTKKLKANKIEYPLSDARSILNIGKEPNSTDVPLEICCTARNASIDMMMELLFSDKSKAKRRGRPPKNAAPQ